MGLISQKVARTVADSYFSAMRRRYEHIAKRINESLKPDQVGLLVIQEDHMVQFPSDIEVFTVAPPALDEIRRWQREQRERPAAKEEPPQKEAG